MGLVDGPVFLPPGPLGYRPVGNDPSVPGLYEYAHRGRGLGVGIEAQGGSN